MKESKDNYHGYAVYLLRLLGREPSTVELSVFINNQDLLSINKRTARNDAYHISFFNSTLVQLMPEGVLRGGAIQLHSQDGRQRFYTVLLQESATEEQYLMLDASVESAVVNGNLIDVVQHIRLISIEDFVLLYSPIMYS
jgi:hypothetical protein